MAVGESGQAVFKDHVGSKTPLIIKRDTVVFAMCTLSYDGLWMKVIPLSVLWKYKMCTLELMKQCLNVLQ